MLDGDAPIDRRGFLGDALKACVAMSVLAACGGGGDGGGVTEPPPNPGQPNLDVNVTLSQFPVLASVNGVARIGSGRTGFFLIRTAQDQFRALSFVCPHQATNNQWTIAGTGTAQQFRCGNHGAEFNLEGTPQNNVTRNGMRRFTTEFNATTGIVRVTGNV